MEVRRFEITDVKDVTALHMWAFKDHLNVLLGRVYISAFLTWFIDRKDCVNVLGKLANGETGGYIVGAPWGYQQIMNKDLITVAAKEMLKRPWLIFHKKIIASVWLRVKTILGMNKFISETSLKYEGRIISLVGIGVAENAQGSGLASEMMHVFIEQSRRAGYTYARLSVYAANKRARKFYEKMGWLPESATTPVMGYFKKL